MEDFKKEDLDKLKLLCRIECTQEEDEKLLKNLKSIFQHIATLQTAQTEGIVGKHNLLECESNVMGEDTVGQILSNEEFLQNAPDHVGGMIKVPTVIQFE
jgi:aspartyl-tRNA(Asn)/glutamyl-tRNA(Gln) amidotransferase subunit C